MTLVRHAGVTETTSRPDCPMVMGKGVCPVHPPPPPSGGPLREETRQDCPPRRTGTQEGQVRLATVAAGVVTGVPQTQSKNRSLRSWSRPRPTEGWNCPTRWGGRTSSQGTSAGRRRPWSCTVMGRRSLCCAFSFCSASFLVFDCSADFGRIC